MLNNNKKKQQVKFIAKLSKQGDKKIIIVPVQHHGDVEKFTGKSIKVTVEDAISEDD